MHFMSSKALALYVAPLRKREVLLYLYLYVLLKAAILAKGRTPRNQQPALAAAAKAHCIRAQHPKQETTDAPRRKKTQRTLKENKKRLHRTNTAQHYCPYNVTGRIFLQVVQIFLHAVCKIPRQTAPRPVKNKKETKYPGTSPHTASKMPPKQNEKRKDLPTGPEKHVVRSRHRVVNFVFVLFVCFLAFFHLTMVRRRRPKRRHHESLRVAA